MAYIVKHRTHKCKDDTDEQRPFRYLIAATVNSHWIRINRINNRPEIDNQTDCDDYSCYKKKYTNFLHNVLY